MFVGSFAYTFAIAAIRSACPRISWTRPLPVKILNGFLYVAPRKLLDHSFQFGVFLAHDLFELYGFHASILQLCKRASRLDRFMLPPISDQQDAIIG